MQYSLSVVIVEPDGDGEEGAPGLEVAPGQIGPLVDGALVLPQLGKMGQGEGPEVSASSPRMVWRGGSKPSHSSA